MPVCWPRPCAAPASTSPARATSIDLFVSEVAAYSRLPIEIVAEAHSADSAYRAFCEVLPQVVVLDIAMPGASGVDALRRMLARRSTARILVCSMYDDAVYVARCLESGASGYVTKAAVADVLADAIKTVGRGQRYLSPDAATAYARWQVRERDALATLSARELEVLRQIVRGATLQQVAATMNLSEKTVANYQTVIRQKLGARNAAQLVQAAARAGISGHSGG